MVLNLAGAQLPGDTASSASEILDKNDEDVSMPEKRFGGNAIHFAVLCLAVRRNLYRKGMSDAIESMKSTGDLTTHLSKVMISEPHTSIIWTEVRARKAPHARQW